MVIHKVHQRNPLHVPWTECIIWYMLKLNIKQIISSIVQSVKQIYNISYIFDVTLCICKY